MKNEQFTFFCIAEKHAMCVVYRCLQCKVRSRYHIHYYSHILGNFSSQKNKGASVKF